MINWRGDLLDVLNRENYVSSEKAKLTIIVDLKFVLTPVLITMTLKNSPLLDRRPMCLTKHL